MLLIMLFWLIIILLCYTIVSLRLSISRLTSLRLIPLPSYLGKVAIGNRGSLLCVACGSVYSMVYGAVVCYSYCADR